MDRRELSLAFVFSILLGGILIFIFAGSEGFSLKPLNFNAEPSIGFRVRNVANSPISTLNQPAEEPAQTSKLANPTPTQVSIEEGTASGVDIEDVLLLYSGSNSTTFDTNFCRIAEYYGILCKQVNLDTVPLTEDVFIDEQGKYFKLIGIQAENLLLNRFLVSSSERDVIKSVIEQAGANLLISELSDENFASSIIFLTDGAIKGITKPADSSKDWIISSNAPEITRELTGQVFTRNSEHSPHDLAIVIGNQEAVSTLMSSVDDSGREYAFLATVDIGLGMIIIDASDVGPRIDVHPIHEIYYNKEWFSRIIPLMVTVRYVMGDEAWHSSPDYANLTLDNLWLANDVPYVDYVALVREMEAHDFHITIGFTPSRWEESDPEVMSLFRIIPNRLSIAQYGNNADGYEFYKYEINPRDWFAGDPKPARPLADQEADIAQGLSRLESHWARHGITSDPVMIFPGISPERTLVILKENNYLATVNSRDVPLGSIRALDWDYGMYQANLDYSNFPMLTRRNLEDLQTFQKSLEYLIFDLFIDKPALMYSSAGKLFSERMDTFSPFADELNKLTGDLEWRSLAYIIRHLHLEKENDDGSLDVKMYANNLTLENTYGVERDYHVMKEETLNVPISSVTVNGYEFPYTVSDGMLQLDLRIPAGMAVEIFILYEKQSS